MKRIALFVLICVFVIAMCTGCKRVENTYEPIQSEDESVLEGPSFDVLLSYASRAVGDVVGESVRAVEDPEKWDIEKTDHLYQMTGPMKINGRKKTISVQIQFGEDYEQFSAHELEIEGQPYPT